MGELHLEVLVDRMLREFSVDANVGKPQVAYRETIRKPVEKVEERYVRQTGGRGQYGHVVISLEPTGPGGGYEFVDKITGGVIPKEYIPGGRRRHPGGARPTGVLAGYPMVDVRVTLTYGSYHDVDSSEMAFKIAGSMAFKKAARRASPVLLEPVMAVEVVTPEDYMGDVIGDLSARRGKVEGMEQRGTSHVVRAHGAAGRHVRLRYRPAFAHPGPGHVHDAVPLLPRGPRVDRHGDHRPGTRRVAALAPRTASRHGTQSATQYRRQQDSRSRRARGGAAGDQGAVSSHGQAEVRAHEAPRQRRDDGAHRPRQDDADRGHHQGAVGGEPQRRRSPPSTRSTRRPRRSSAASRSRSPTSSTRPTTATTRTSTCRATPTTSRT